MASYLYEVLDHLIRFNTVSSQSLLPAIEYLADQMSSHGLKTAVHKIEVLGVPQANLVAWAGPAAPGGLIITGHLDTVPA